MYIVEGKQERHIPMEIQRCDTFFSRFLGLMGRKTMTPGTGMLLVPCQSIHMFFMRFPIDAVFISKDHRIVHLSEGLRPWQVVPKVHEAYAVLELPAGSVKAYGLQLDQRLRL